MNATVSSKGQVVIPQKIRESLGIVAGSSVDFVIKDNVLQLHVIRNKPLSTLQAGHGMLKHKGRALPPDFDVATLLSGRTKAKPRAITKAKK
ncbi:MAG: AbrB/MazE/SpoVT family DNA-binding domain-containing protein [Betaproteobacteria bacterium]|nr:AbrB/MazE/SpoVT family DNA-binding domain-containing protein [Betaproteobacteria bacterium]